MLRLNVLDDLDESRFIPPPFGEDVASLSSVPLGVWFACCRLAASSAFCSAFDLLAMVIASRIVRQCPIALLYASLSSEATSSSFLFSRCEASAARGEKRSVVQSTFLTNSWRVHDTLRVHL